MMKRAPRFDHDAAVRAVESGKTMADVAREYGVSRERVRQVVNLRGLCSGQSKRAMAAQRAQVPDLVRQGMSDKAIAAELGAALETVVMARREADLSPAYKHELLAKEVKRLADEGLSFRQINKKLGLTRTTAERHAATTGIKSMHGRWRDISHRPELVAKVRNSGGTWSDVAKAFAAVEGIEKSAQNAFNWAKKHAADVSAAKQRANSCRTPSHRISHSLGA